MSDQTSQVKAFRDLHKKGVPFILPNPWDAGSARILEGLGAKALATTSSGFALTKGRHDYGVSREDALAHCREVASAVSIPVTADLENGYGLKPEDAGETISLAAQTGLAGGSIEDSTGDKATPIIEKALAVERMAAAAEAVNSVNNNFVLTARAEAFLYGDADLDEVIGRLKAFEEAGAEALFAPGLPDMDAVRAVCDAVSKRVNVLVIGELRNHALEEFAEAGVASLSIGGALAYQAYGSLAGLPSMLETGRFDMLNANAAQAKTVSQYLQG
ncbi:MAG: 2-methylisocitrate lyase [Hyphococcus sp.]|nr:MAG: 2-methylisocitrate lyase [Marinicaulis sp.]